MYPSGFPEPRTNTQEHDRSVSTYQQCNNMCHNNRTAIVVVIEERRDFTNLLFAYHDLLIEKRRHAIALVQNHIYDAYEQPRVQVLLHFKALDYGVTAIKDNALSGYSLKASANCSSVVSSEIPASRTVRLLLVSRSILRSTGWMLLSLETYTLRFSPTYTSKRSSFFSASSSASFDGTRQRISE